MNTPQQSASAVLMVRPTTFCFNEQTAVTNTFQNQVDLNPDQLKQQVNQEFDAMVDAIRRNGIAVTVFEDPDTHASKPDAVFPNNWFSTWTNGDIYLYPMATESRRKERSYAALQELSRNYKITSVTDITSSEEYGFNLESTGVMIFDHINKVVYGCISERCDAALFTSHALHLGYEPIVFHAYDSAGVAVYHTNVLMGIASTTATICAEAITDEAERTLVLNKLKDTGHEVVTISQAQMAQFCGNVLELQNTQGQRFLAMSQTAYGAFSPEQRDSMSRDKALLPFDIKTIETVGGGSVRCMLGEVFLPAQ
jgi:hypothetical protein